MKINGFKVFEGRNIYSHKKCIRLDLNLEGYSEIPSKCINGFNDNLLKLLPELSEHRCGINEEGGFVKRLAEGTYLAHVTEHVIIALQNLAGLNVSYGKSREISGEKYYVIYEYEYKKTGLAAGSTAVNIINSLISNEDFDFESKINMLKNTLSGEQLGISTLRICEEAKKRGIPMLRIGPNSIFQLGYGKYSKTIEATLSSDTSAIAVDIAQDKLLTKEILEINCLPVADGMKVNSRQEALEAAGGIGYPVVLKPQYGNQGRGVIPNIKDERELLSAYESLEKEYGDIILEKHINGRDYRVCSVFGDIAAVSERLAPYIIGDGKRTIGELVEELNEDSRRGEGHEKELTRVKIDDVLLKRLDQKNYTMDSILPEKEKLNLRENSNLSTGGYAIDCTDLICHENIEICKRAASSIGLDICGIDILCEDIGKPINKSGAIIEINAAPGIRMHHNPYMGVKRNVASLIVDKLFENIPHSIPLISVTGTNGKTTTTRLIGHILSLAGYNVGMTTTGGIYINGRCIYKGDTTGPKSALAVLTNKSVDAAVLETARGGMLRGGLAYDLADVGVITNITEDHLGIGGIDTLEDLAKVKALVGEAVKDDGYVVINADDKMSLSVINRFKSNLIFFSNNKNNEFMKLNIKNGGYGVYTEKGSIIVQKGSNTEKITEVKSIGITMDGILKYNIENAMAACAAAIALGIDRNIIKKGLESFYGSYEQNPGRFNIYQVNGVTAILDYGHNIEAYKGVLEGLKQMKHNNLIGVIGVPGDRLDRDIIEVGKCSGKYFDYIFIKEDEDRRGRNIGEVAGLLEKGTLISKFSSKKIKKILVEKEAFKEALEFAGPGDIVIVFFEKFEPLLNVVKNMNIIKSEPELLVKN